MLSLPQEANLERTSLACVQLKLFISATHGGSSMGKLNTSSVSFRVLGRDLASDQVHLLSLGCTVCSTW